MTDQEIDRLKMRLVRTVLNLHMLEQEKKDSLASYNEALKTAKEKIELLANAINSNNISELEQRFPEELHV